MNKKILILNQLVRNAIRDGRLIMRQRGSDVVTLTANLGGVLVTIAEVNIEELFKNNENVPNVTEFKPKPPSKVQKAENVIPFKR